MQAISDRFTTAKRSIVYIYSFAAMKLSVRPYLLEFKHPFGVSSNTRTGTPTVFVRLEEQGLNGYGEACLPGYLGETTEATLAFLEKAMPFLEHQGIPKSFEDFFSKLDALLPGHYAAKAAIDIALHDLVGKREGKRIGQLYGITDFHARDTSMTIGIDREEMIAQKIREAVEFPILKIKAGTADDKALIAMVRKHSDKPLYVDANQGWRDKEKALALVEWMAGEGVVLIEQPMPVTLRDESAWLTARSPLPVIADESVKRLSDLKETAGVFSGVNIKLMKCTGLHEAVKMIRYCHEHQLKVLLGCMAESSCATSAMAQLMALADFVDLDAPNLIRNDPFHGLSYRDGSIVLSERPGTGAEPVSGLFSGKIP